MTADLFECMRTLRAVRRFEPRPIPKDVLHALLTAATWAPSGSNSQPWGFVAVRDSGLKRSVRDLYLTHFASADRAYTAFAEAAGTLDDRQRRLMAAARELAEHLDDAAVLLFPCIDKQRYPIIFDADGNARDPLTLYASILPAVQNLLLAARAHGIGGCLTTILRFCDREVRALLALPAHVATTVMVPLGYPRDPFGPLTRRPASAVTYRDRWGTPLFDAD